MDWVTVRCNFEENAAHFKRLANYERDFDLNKCIPLADRFPTDAEVRMDPEFPDDIELVDSLRSNGDLLIVNERVRSLFEAEGVRNIELLPVNVINHKGKAVKERYTVVNLLSRIDCIDLGKSKFKINSIDKVSISVMSDMVLDPQRLPKDIKLFRPQRFETIMLIDRALAEKIQEEGLRGFLFEEVQDFTYP
jgi:hypothetical protein